MENQQDISSNSIYNDPLYKYLNKTYNLEGTPNMCHVQQWEVGKDFIEVCQTCDISNINRFYEIFIKNYDVKLDEYSNGTRMFYDSAWKSRNKITFNIQDRFMNYIFREMIYQNKNITKELIQWFVSLNVIGKGHYHCALNTLCHTGGLETAKIMHEVQPFDFTWNPNDHEYILDYFRTALTENNLEMGKWLYQLGAHIHFELGYQNIKSVVNSRANDEVKEWLNSLDEFKSI